MTIRVDIADPLDGSRIKEPIIFTVPGHYPEALYTAETSRGDVIACQRVSSSSDSSATTFIAVVDLEGAETLELGGPWVGDVDGIRTLEAVEGDAFVRLDTGYFDLELCSGTAEGEGSSKWGLRHFSAHHEGVDLLASGNNAIGGFYGPFFTPENGLINPPEHTTVRIETVEEGPVLHHYRMHGTVPDGLLEELRGKTFRIDWIFTYGTPSFRRRYDVDSFRTVINGRSVTDKITVGDEFEGGPGELVFDRFESHHSTRYRAGDPYAQQLVNMVEEALAHGRSDSEKFTEIRDQLADGMESAHWDLYWRLFCAWEEALPDEEISQRLAVVREHSHFLADAPDRPWVISERPVDVSAVPDATIFTGAVQKSAEFHSVNRRAMVWWTGQPSGGFQIVQRKESGWVNWGSNTENECPELPVGVPIKTAYGNFAKSWHAVADQLELEPTVRVAER